MGNEQSQSPIPLGCPFCGALPFFTVVTAPGEMDAIKIYCDDDKCSVKPHYQGKGTVKRPIIQVWNQRVELEIRHGHKKNGGIPAASETRALALLRSVYEYHTYGTLLSRELGDRIAQYLSTQVGVPRSTANHKK